MQQRSFRWHKSVRREAWLGILKNPVGSNHAEQVDFEDRIKLFFVFMEKFISAGITG